LQRFYELASITFVDGMGVVALGKLLGKPLHRCHRTTYVDWLPALMLAGSQRSWRVFFLGSTSETNERGIGLLSKTFPAVRIQGHHGFFGSRAESDAAAAAMREFKPDLVFVGMGMPRQEQWITRNWEALPQAVFLNAGACLEYVAGAQRTPPRWLGRVGLEWTYRLASDPTRLARRYLVEPWAIGMRAFREMKNRS
jgi:N-acetylglucosaminyldiphosphoundecaprenol N-acetyl-beta-D-mannosaminyltransferase